jgi:hypothetical protein
MSEIERESVCAVFLDTNLINHLRSKLMDNTLGQFH